MGMVSFFYKLETWEAMIEISFIFTQALNRENICFKQVFITPT